MKLKNEFLKGLYGHESVNVNTDTKMNRVFWIGPSKMECVADLLHLNEATSSNFDFGHDFGQ